MFIQTSAMDFEETEWQPVRSRRSTLGQCSAIALSESPDNCTHPLIRYIVNDTSE